MRFFVFNAVNKIENKDLGIVQIPDEKISKEEVKQKILSGKSWDKNYPIPIIPIIRIDEIEEISKEVFDIIKKTIPK